MDNVMVQLLLVSWILTSQQVLPSEQTFSCAKYFCNVTIVQPSLTKNCTDLLSDPEECYCYPHWTPGLKKCDKFIVSNVVINVELGSKSTESIHNQSNTRISIVVAVTRRSEFEILWERILMYLPLTNIREVDFHAVCTLDLTYDFERDNQVRILKLSKNYPENLVEQLKLQWNCLNEIEGQFSFSFPYLSHLGLHENNLQFIHPGTFQNLNYLLTLRLDQNRLLSLSNERTFHGLSLVRYLDLSFINAPDYHPRLLTPLVHLQYLNLSHSRSENLLPELFQQNVELETLDLSSCGLNNSFLMGMSFKKLAKLKYLDLCDNRLETIPADTFHPNVRLEGLLLGRNYIKDLSFLRYFLNVDVLDMSSNCLYKMNYTTSFLENGLSLTKGIERLICYDCCLNTETAGQLAELVTRAVNLQSNNIGEIDMTFLMKVTHLEYVILSPIRFDSSDEKHLLSVTSRRLKISLALEDPLYIESFKFIRTEIWLVNYEFSTCDFFTIMMVNLNLTKSQKPELVRSNMNFYIINYTIEGRTYVEENDFLTNETLLATECEYHFYCPSQCACSTKGLFDTIAVNCSNKELTSFPNTKGFKNQLVLHLSSNHIQRLKKIDFHDWEIYREIYLDHNHVSTLENFQISPSLQILDLRRNRLKHLPELKLLFVNNYQINLKLSENPWECDCETVTIKNILSTGNVRDFKEITCVPESSERFLFLINATGHEFCPLDEMPKILLKILLPVLVILALIVIIVLVMYYRYKEFLKLWLFRRGLCLRFVTEEDIDADKIYDAFISYSSIDEEWVANNLVHPLEHEPPPYKLCLHGRDWLAGVWIMHQIVASVKQSRRTIIVLTDNFLASQWSRMEFMVAYKQAIEDHVDRILVVLPGEVPDSATMGPELASFVALNTYLKWGDPHFWRKLRCSLLRLKQLHGPHEQEIVQMPGPRDVPMEQLPGPNEHEMGNLDRIHEQIMQT